MEGNYDDEKPFLQAPSFHPFTIHARIEAGEAVAAPHCIHLGPASTPVAWTGIIYDHRPTDLRLPPPPLHHWRRHCRRGRRRVAREATRNRERGQQL